jgi:2',3'-cyclic-nucleotide 2'-phosphodiesterase/3'-nucleotidase
MAAQLRAAGADLVIALCHSGIGFDPPGEGMENAALPLAATDGIDAIVAGHAHLAFPSPRHPAGEGVDVLQGTIAGKPAVMPGCFGSHLGVIDLLLEHEFAAGWRILSHRSTLRAAQAASGTGPARGPTLPDPAILSLATPAHRATLGWLEQPVGWTDRPLSTAFAMVAPCEALRLLAAAKARHVRDRLQGTPHAHLPVLASSAPFRAGGRGGPSNFTLIQRGPLSLRHVLDLYPHPNTIAALRLTGAELVDWLEHATGVFRRIRAGGRAQLLVDPDVPGFQFDVIHGLDFRIDLSQPARFDHKGQLADPAARRITQLTWQGEAIRPEAEFILATNSYRAGGGGGFAGTGPGRIILSEPVAVRDILTEHIRTRGTVLPPARGSWSFVPMPGTSVQFATSPDARHFLRDAGDLALEQGELDEDGFLTFRLSL